MDFYDVLRCREENMPENLVYGTWIEKKLGIHKLLAGEHIFRFECAGSHPLSKARSGAPGLECRVDGISLRRFRWDDLAGWMARYLEEEDALFRSRVERARAEVREIEAAVERYRRDLGEYPERLEDLIEPPGRLAGAAGQWPYLERVARDPWGQLYRLHVPGRFNPSRFDVYSVHGDSRAPSGWIGNWPDPYRLEDAVEGEELSALSRSEGTTDLIQELSLEEPSPLSGGKLRFVRFRGEGGRIEFLLPESLEPGPRRVRLRLLASWDYCVLGVSLNGVAVSPPIDGYSPRIRTLTADCGVLEIRRDRNVLALECAGRNPRSRGHFAGLDAVILERPAD